VAAVAITAPSFPQLVDGNGTAGATLASADDNGNGGGMVFTLHSTLVEDTEIDLGGTGFSQGDRLVFRDRLITMAGERVGLLHGDCVFTQTGPSRVSLRCGVTAAFGRHSSVDFAGAGTFTAEQASGPFFLPVAGGSGRYIGAEGEVRVTFLSETRTELRFRLVD
jgi:hypothetical protein